VHGSFDWFWEFAGLGAPAFAMLGLACSLAPRSAAAAAAAGATSDRGVAASAGDGGSRSRRRAPAIAAAALAAALCAWSLGAPWLSQLQVQSAARVWRRSRSAAYTRLQSAASLNPLSDEAYLVAGSIALRLGEVAHADREFAAALARTPGDAYATLERGAIASQAGRRVAALALLTRAVALDPRDGLAQEALQIARQGRRVDVAELNRAILLKAQQLS